MNTEYEVKVLDINVEALKVKLNELGFSEENTQQFRRYIYNLTANDNAWVRLRTDGAKTTLTIKEYQKNSIDGMQEVEVTVGDFDTAHVLLTKMGLTAEKYQENLRVNFSKDNSNVQISIDSWPHIPTYMEIEGDSESAVQKTLDALEIGDLPTTSEPTSAVYTRYGLDLDAMPNLVFEDK